MPRDELIIRELLERIRDGCPNAFRLLFEKHQDAVLYFIQRSYLPSGSALHRDLDPIDLAQEAWLEIIRKLQHGKTFDSHADFRRFLLAIADSKFKQYYRYRVLAAMRSTAREEPFGAAEPFARQRDPAEQTAAEDESAQMLAPLTPAELALLLGMRNGQTQAEIAQQLGISIRTVKRLLQHIRQTTHDDIGGGHDGKSTHRPL